MPATVADAPLLVGVGVDAVSVTDALPVFPPILADELSPAPDMDMAADMLLPAELKADRAELETELGTFDAAEPDCALPDVTPEGTTDVLMGVPLAEQI